MVFIIFSLSFAGIAWAAGNTLTFQFTGLEKNKDIAKNVQLALQNEKSQIIKPITKYGVDEFYKTAPKAIEEAMQPYGYFHPTIRSSKRRRGNQWVVSFRIRLGPPVRISKLSIDIVGPGSNERSFQRFLQKQPLKVGNILNTEEYQNTKQLLYDISSSHGYFDAKMLENKIYIDLKDNRAQIILKFQTGRRYRFGDTLFSHSPFSLSFLYRFLSYKEGQKYNYKKIERTQQNFINSNYFSQAIVTPKTNRASNGEVPIYIKIKPRKRYAYTLGAGFGTDTGPRAIFGFDVRRINRHGHQFQTMIQASQYNSNAFATYFIPGGNPASDVWTITTGYANFNQVTGTGNSYKAEGAYTTSLGRWKQTIALTYLNERYNIVGFQETETQMLFPNIHWQFITPSDQLNPKNGFNFSGSLSGAPKLGFTPSSFFQARINISSLVTFFNTTRLILRTSLARTQIDKLQDLPFSLQLFIGGARSLRGYSFNQIGPGRNLFLGSIEVQQRIVGDFYIVGFFDFGNVSDNSPFQNLNEGVGPGIAYQSPLGMIELTIANAITQPNRPWVIQFSMGPTL